MSSIKTVVDIRADPDSPDLIIVKQSVDFVNGAVQLVGEPTEVRLEMSKGRVKIWPSYTTGIDRGVAVVAQVTNTGFIPVVVEEVVLEWDGSIELNDRSPGMSIPGTSALILRPSDPKNNPTGL